MREKALQENGRYATSPEVAVPLVRWTTGDIIRKLRLQADWRQAELADRAGLHVTTVIELEKYGENSDQSTLKAVLNALGVSEAQFYAYRESLRMIDRLLRLREDRRLLVLDSLLQMERKQKQEPSPAPTGAETAAPTREAVVPRASVAQGRKRRR